MKHGMGTTSAPSPDNKRAKGLRSPRQKKRALTPDAERIANMALSRLADAASTEQVRMSQLSDIEPGFEDLSSSQHHTAPPHAVAGHHGGGGGGLHQTVDDYSILQGSGGMSQDLMQQPDLPSQPDIPRTRDALPGARLHICWLRRPAVANARHGPALWPAGPGRERRLRGWQRQRR